MLLQHVLSRTLFAAASPRFFMREPMDVFDAGALLRWLKLSHNEAVRDALGLDCATLDTWLLQLTTQPMTVYQHCFNALAAMDKPVKIIAQNYIRLQRHRAPAPAKEPYVALCVPASLHATLCDLAESYYPRRTPRPEEALAVLVKNVVNGG